MEAISNDRVLRRQARGRRVANEPRNVGVIAATGRGADSRVATRFLGVDLDGTSARRPLPGVPKNIYLAWVNYFRVKTREDRWEDIARARRRRPQDFYLDHVLTILDGDDVERIVDEYFSRLVQTAGRSGRQLIEWNQVHLDVVRMWIILSRRRLDGPPGGVGRGGEDEYGAIGPKFSDARDARDLGSPDVDGRERHRDAAGTLVAQGHALR